MPVPAYRQPWFWALIIAVVAIMVFGVVIFASNANRSTGETTTIVQQPNPVENTPVVTPPVTNTPAPAPETTTTPAPPPPPQVIREKTVIIREPESDTTPKPETSVTPAPEKSTFRDTKLPKDLRFQDTRFEATGTQRVEDPNTELKSIGTAEDSSLLFVSPNATEPYQSVLVPIPDRPNEYVTYRRR